jgi:hypothetical protein
MTRVTFGRIVPRVERRLGWAGATLALALACLPAIEAAPQPHASTAPQTLEQTGLYSELASLQVDPSHFEFSPQYPLWSDGATKRRWISLPPGTSIDASDPDAWVFPVGTRFWKEFSFGGQRVETRYMELRRDGRWVYAAYAWSPDGSVAELVSQRGRRSAYALGGGRSHAIPSVNDCKACHQGGPTEILGFSALQLSSDRDPRAVHRERRPVPEIDLRGLVEKGLLTGLPKPLRDSPPHIPTKSATERAALGYLHGNCGHCHNDRGPLRNLSLWLRHRSEPGVPQAILSTVGQIVRKQAPGLSAETALRIKPQDPDRSALMQRIASRDPLLQMPPLGTELVDQEAVALIRRWIAEVDASQKEDHQEKQQ